MNMRKSNVMWCDIVEIHESFGVRFHEGELEKLKDFNHSGSIISAFSKIRWRKLIG